MKFEIPIIIVTAHGNSAYYEFMIMSHPPHAKKSQDDGNVFLEGRRAEVVVHEVGAVKKPLEVVEAEVEGDGQPDGGPQGIPPPDPVPEPEHVVGVDAKLGHLGRVG